MILFNSKVMFKTIAVIFIFNLIIVNGFCLEKKDSVKVYLSPNIIKSDSVPNEMIITINNYSSDTLLYIKRKAVLQNNRTDKDMLYPFYTYYDTHLYFYDRRANANQGDVKYNNAFKKFPEFIFIKPNDSVKIIMKFDTEYKNILKKYNEWKAEVWCKLAIKSNIDYLIKLFFGDKYYVYKNKISTGKEFIIENNNLNDTNDSKNDFTECEKQIFTKVLYEFNIWLFSK